MSNNVRSKTVTTLILFNLIFVIFLSINVSSNDISWWDKDWSYNQEIIIPIDTSLEISKYQPIDIKIDFNNKCWAKNVVEHSIRICTYDNNNWWELDSQIYNLNYFDTNFIESCSIVFLIPEDADGNERYFVYYDDSEKQSTDYTNHISIDESYYRYEPIPGYPLESEYYRINDDGYIIYIISQEGQFMGYNTCQHITKMNEKTTEVLPKNGDLFSAFDFKYSYDLGLFDYSSTSQKLVSKELLVEGNLMAEIGMISTSKLDDLQTTATYKYYHCPTEHKRIHAHVKHETLEEIKVHPEAKTDGSYGSLQSGGVKSNSISDLNFGEILPYMHSFNEIGSISSYQVDVDPDYIPEDPDIRIISTSDDVDLGEKPWISFDEGSTGLSHSVIFSSNKLLKSGTSEVDGLQINAFEMDYPHLPGLENNIATIQFGRNTYENSNDHDLTIPNNFVVEFDAEFFSSKTGGYEIIEQESEIFRELASIKPISDEDIEDDTDEGEKYSLTVYTHLSSSIPMGSALSALLGHNLSYINVELYKENEFIHSGTSVKLPMNPITETEDMSIIQQLIAAIRSFDWKNLSVFKKITFPELSEGKYLIKVFRENPLLRNERQFIGFEIVDLKENTKTHIYTRSEGFANLIVTDQNDNLVENADVILKMKDTELLHTNTDEKGIAIISAPHIQEKYQLCVLYNGFIIYEESERLKLLGKLDIYQKNIELERYNLQIEVYDTWDLVSEIEFNPVISSKDMYEEIFFIF